MPKTRWGNSSAIPLILVLAWWVWQTCMATKVFGIRVYAAGKTVDKVKVKLAGKQLVPTPWC